MFTDVRGKSIVFVAHCVLNQNSISDGTAAYRGSIVEIVELLRTSDVGIVQMPCPELLCLGLDRGDVDGGSRPVVQENTRIREMMSRQASAARIRLLVQDLVFQIAEYQNYGFDVLGIVGIDRSPSCGVNSTSKDNREVEGEGVFIEALRDELGKQEIHVEIIGINALEAEKAVKAVQNLIGFK